MTKRKMTQLLMYVIVGVILFGFAIMVYVCFWIKRTHGRALRNHTLPADPNYDETESIAKIDVSYVRSSHTNSNQDQHLTHQGSSGISIRENLQTIIDHESHTSEETTSDFFDIGLQQREDTTEVHQMTHTFVT